MMMRDVPARPYRRPRRPITGHSERPLVQVQAAGAVSPSRLAV